MCRGPLKRVCHWGPLTALELECAFLTDQPAPSSEGLPNAIVTSQPAPSTLSSEDPIKGVEDLSSTIGSSSFMPDNMDYVLLNTNADIFLNTNGIIKIVTFMTVHCSSMWWPPDKSLAGFLHLSVFLSLSGLTLYHFMNAIYLGPGYLPPGWAPENADHTDLLQFCNTCQGYKAPRTHHCRKVENSLGKNTFATPSQDLNFDLLVTCYLTRPDEFDVSAHDSQSRCVMKMDHHCPWINNCVGHKNHAHFAGFLFFAVCGCLLASVTLSCSLYRALNRVLTLDMSVFQVWYMYYGTGTEPIVYLSVTTLILYSFTSLLLSIAGWVVFGMESKLDHSPELEEEHEGCSSLTLGSKDDLSLNFLTSIASLRAIHQNQTAIEDWIVEKAKHRRREGELDFVYPYNLGWRENYKQVLSWSCDPLGDGLHWSVVEGCDQYTITKEQQLQKCEKRQRTRVYSAHTPYSGWWFPVVHGFGVFTHPPFTDEARITLQRGDTIHVTRWRKYWLFGEKVCPGASGDTSSRARGWFPRPCAVEVTEGPMMTPFDSGDKKDK
uniref:Palmitoyltransferase n=1 Tax=Timema bartmani TaxID=61472 RepID=A0A7R9EVE0_9NEOP|nr:unnamed protein product [Timema bartmani]